MNGRDAELGGPTGRRSQPVFLDRTGRRRRVAVLAGTSMGVGLLVSLGLIVAGLFGGSAIPLPGWPRSEVPPPRGEAEVRPTDRVELTNPPVQSPQPTDGVNRDRTTPTPTSRATTRPGQTRPTSTERPGGNDPTRVPPGHRPSKSPGRPK